MKKDLIKIELSIIYSIILFLLLTVNLFSQTISHRASSKYIIINSNGADTVWVKNVAKDSANTALNRAKQAISDSNSVLYNTIDTQKLNKSDTSAIRTAWQALWRKDAGDSSNYALYLALQQLNNAVSGINSTISSINDNISSITLSISNLSKRVDTLEAKLGIPTFPDVLPPTNLTATGGTRQITLSWTNSTSPHDSLYIFRSLTLNDAFVQIAAIDSGTATTYINTGLSDNTTYYYYMLAKKGTIWSNATPIVNARTLEIVREPYTILMDAETGNVSQWSSVVKDSTNQFEVVDSVKAHGLYSFLVKDNHINSDNAYGRKNITAIDSGYVRMYIYIPSTFKSLDTPNSFYIMTNFSGNTVLSGLLLARTTNVTTHKLSIQNGSSVTDILNPFPKNQWVCLEMFYKKGTGSNSIVKIWKDDVLIYNNSTGTATGNIDNIRFGTFSFGSRVDIGSYYFIDDCVFNNSYIGLFGGSSGGGGGSSTSKRIYLSVSGNGSQTGVDSANAFPYSSFSFSTLTPGDTVVFLGGNYTLNQTLSLSGTASNLITFMGSYPYGAVISSSGNAFYLTNSNYLRFKHLKFQNIGRAIRIGITSKVIYIDSCYFAKASSQGIVAFIGGSSSDITLIDSIFIRYNYAENDTQTYTQADIVYAQYCNNLFIIKNTFIQKDTIDVNQHIDCIQTGNSMGNVIIVGNKLTNYKKESSQGMMLNIPISGYEQVIYNNSVYVPSNAKGISSAWITQSGAKVYYLNNTVYNRSAIYGWVGITFEAQGRNGVVSFNNISYNDGTPTAVNIFTAIQYEVPVTWGDSINNNLYWTNYCPSPPGSPSAGQYFSVSTVSNLISLSQWQAYTGNPDRNSIQTNPSFKDKTTGDLRLAIDSPAIGTGKDISSLISYLNSKYPNCGFEWRDINGLPRNSTPNMGAYEGAY